MIRRVLLALLAGLLVVFVPAAPALAAESAPITRMHIAVELTPDGTAHTVLDFTMDFGEDSGHGPVLKFFTTQRDGRTYDEVFVFEYSRPRVTSSTGAATQVSVEEGRSDVVWRIGDENRVNHSPQHYRVSFDVRGMVAPHHPESGLDEFNWQVFSEVRSQVSNLTASVSGPAPVERAACWHGRHSNDPCQATVRDGTAAMQLDRISRNEGVQLVAGFPAGTFPGAVQSKRRAPSAVSNLVPSPAVLGIAGGLSVVLGVGGWVLNRRSKRDLVYLGLTPGIVPARDDQERIGLQDTSKITVAVQFQPPKGASPGEIGTLVDATADGVDVTATLVDLAVRGHLVIEPMGRDELTETDEFTLHRTDGGSDRLQSYERSLLDSVFDGDETRTMQELRDERFHDVMSNARDRLYSRMVDRRWFVRNPHTAGKVWGVVGVVLFLLGVVLVPVLWWWSLALVALPFLIAGLSCVAISSNRRRRTALGSAMLQQARGFELYLRTAEADQIRFEESIDVFSRYLPYAMIFGVADRWAKVFKRLEAESRYHGNTDWLLVDDDSTYHWISRLDTFSSSFSDALVLSSSAAEPSSASWGGSGFSGGGGFGGGSVGSW
ncbi:DUF2207 domain-containing protein [uncultured Tessaracoccus sp.]|uniref:DUF2207 domain-containing protein n=1 Tax=uncultured Tessaracoccus sp. TaxID=905023 RepID=UPI0025FDEFF7|nr:DUF2207 domain-containing protein [uncultured Tessaracoccus sp.]